MDECAVDLKGVNETESVSSMFPARDQRMNDEVSCLTKDQLERTNVGKKKRRKKGWRHRDYMKRNVYSTCAACLEPGAWVRH